MLSRKHFLPLTLGIAVGTLQGFLDAATDLIRPAGYVTHGLYRVAAEALVRAINARTLIVCILCYAVWLAFAARGRLTGWIRRIFEVAIIAGVLMILHFDVFSISWLNPVKLRRLSISLSSGVWRDMLANGMPQIGVSVLVLIVGILMLSKVRKTRPKPRVTDVRSSTFGMLSTLSVWISLVKSYLQSMYRWHWEFDAIVLIVFVGLNLTAVFLGISNAFALRSRPNIILIQIDTLRADHLGCYGYSRKTSPNIDAFSAQGMRFEKAISAAPWTSASLADYMTSRNLRVKLNDPSVVEGPPVNAVQLAEVLKDRGYTTLGITSNPLASPDAGFARGYDHYDERYSNITSDMVVNDALKRLGEIKNQKFFLFLLFMEPHSPYALHYKYNFYKDYKGKLGKTVDIGGGDEKVMSPDDLKYTVSLYDSAIAFTDDRIGRLFDSLKKMNLYNDTLIIVLSDHGEEFGEHGMMGHGKHLYDETISVPLIIKMPAQRKGIVVKGAFPLLDLFPSIMDVLHLDSTKLGLQGIARHLQGLNMMRDTDIYSSTDFAFTKCESVTSKSQKLIADMVSSKMELYSLQDDPGEKHNILKSQPGVASMLAGALRNKDREIDDSLAGAVFNSMNDTLRKKQNETLRTLGYLQ